MERTSKDKSSPSRGYNSPDKSLKSEEDPELAKSKPSLKTMSPRSSQKAHLENHSPNNKEDRI